MSEREYDTSEPTFSPAPLTRAAFQTDDEWMRYLAQVQRSRDDAQRWLGPYGDAAQSRGYNTYDERLTRNASKQRRDLFLKMVLPALGFAAGGAGLASIGGGAGAAGTAGSLGAIEGGAPWAITPFAGTASMAPTGAAVTGGAVGAGAGLGTGVGAAAGAGAGRTFLGMSAKELMALALGTAGTIGGALSKKPDMAPNTATTDPQLKELFALMSGRLKKSEPLFDSVQAMANGLLPTQYQKGGGGMG